MDESNYNLGTRPAIGEAYSAGIAYVIIPSDIGREKYIRECYRTSTVSICSEHNGVNHRVPVDLFTLNFIKFPKAVSEIGSAVTFKTDPVHKSPIIDGIYFKADEISNLKEHQFRFRRELNNKFVEIIGSPDGNYLGLNVKADTGGEVYIKVNSEDKSGKLSVDIAGDVNLSTSGNTNITQQGSLNLTTVNKDDEQDFSALIQDSDSHEFFDKEHIVNTGKLNINYGEEPFILGSKWKKFMDDFIDQVGNSTVTTAIGQMPLLNKAQILEFKEKTKELLSKVGFIDK